MNEQITSLGTSLNNIKTNKEYAAARIQLNTTKADNSKLEIQSLELLKNIEAGAAAPYLSRGVCVGRSD